LLGLLKHYRAEDFKWRFVGRHHCGDHACSPKHGLCVVGGATPTSWAIRQHHPAGDLWIVGVKSVFGSWSGGDGVVAGGKWGGGLVASDSPDYWTLALTLSCMTALILVALGMVRAGFLVNFLSHPVLSGFTTAAAIIIGVSQFKHVLGVLFAPK
jgi:MFS superfamily sulfate permease-like transporter